MQRTADTPRRGENHRLPRLAADLKGRVLLDLLNEPDEVRS
jgi:hypothetical protein